MSENNTAIPRPTRGEGQWGLGYFEPLNPAERIKRDLDGLKVRELVEGSAAGGFRSIDKASLRWWGLYTQRKQTANRVVGNPAFSNLPRKFKTSISGCRHRRYLAARDPQDTFSTFVNALDAQEMAAFAAWRAA